LQKAGDRNCYLSSREKRRVRRLSALEPAEEDNDKEERTIA
jgi:hypothetical protein